MGAAAGLAQRLRAAVQEEEPGAVEELLRRGADPNLVLSDGAAAMHLAAGTRHPRGLRCLGALLRGGGDPNARSAEALTPLHVAAAWGCRRGLELLLSQGADPALRDQDGLRPLDLAVQQGHPDCARLLRELGSRTTDPAEAQEPESAREPGSVSGPTGVTLDSMALQAQPSRACSGVDLEAGPHLPDSLESADKDGNSDAPLGCWHCDSESSFVTAVEVSGDEDPALDTSPWARSWPQTTQGLPGLHPIQGTPRPGSGPQLVRGGSLAGREAELSACLQALTLTCPATAGGPPTPSFTSLPDGSPARGPPQEQPNLMAGQTFLDGDVAALWLTEDELSSAEGREPVPSCQLLRVPAQSPLTPLQVHRVLDDEPPVTPSTRQHLLRQLEAAQAAPGPEFSGHSPELAKALRTGHIPDSQADEDALAQQFERPDPTQRWREGIVKSSFTYLLLDPRETQDLPARAFSLTPAECLQTFVRAIFYVGKGTRARPDVHLWEALGYRGRPRRQACPKVRQILDIWDSGRGVVSLHCFQHVVAVEAYTREACLVDALGIQTLTNQKQGHYYGVVADWPPARRRRLGVHLLHRALLVFLAEGQRELRPQDIQARG
ncbi:Ankyrin repeat and LEM domain-containing protein 1 [Sciurus carolinensis]|uniref:Ankyrin repeat and LEM domain-containing protein 1 n=1 Tax=Sciurus carolinensis TaxID=30640 RepID=A0AA41SSQ4_SCICA|nr:Ankyrin repeat and LEM domain-containing protein 1 [Sciurus carolinensis]